MAAIGSGIGCGGGFGAVGRGARLIYVVYAANIVVALLIGVIALIWTTRYLALPVTSSAVIAAILLLGGGPGAALVLWLWRDAFSTGLSWTGEARTPQRAPEVWESLARLPYVVARRTLLPSCVLMVPFTILAVAAMGRSWWTAIPFYGCAVTAVLTSGVLWTLGTDQGDPLDVPGPGERQEGQKGHLPAHVRIRRPHARDGPLQRRSRHLHQPAAILPHACRRGPARGASARGRCDGDRALPK